MPVVVKLMLIIQAAINKETTVVRGGMGTIVYQRRCGKRNAVGIQELLPKGIPIALATAPVRPSAHPDIQAIGRINFIIKAEIATRIVTVALVS